MDSISTGGFSSLSANLAQKWQTKAVAHYMTTKGERPGGLNVSRRCVPDISAYSTGFYTIQDGSDQVSGEDRRTRILKTFALKIEWHL